MNILQKITHWWRGKSALPKIDSNAGRWHFIDRKKAMQYKSRQTKTEAQSAPIEPLYPLARLVVRKGGRNVNTLACAPGLCQGRATCDDLQCQGHPSPDADKHCPLSVAVRPKACPRRGIVSYLPRRPLP
jgi:hypothetical protein